MAKSETVKIEGEELVSYLMERFKCSEIEARARVSAKNKK